MTKDRELCRVCHGNGVVKIPGGVSVCEHCEGDCWEPRHTLCAERHECGWTFDFQARCVYCRQCERGDKP